MLPLTERPLASSASLPDLACVQQRDSPAAASSCWPSAMALQRPSSSASSASSGDGDGGGNDAGGDGRAHPSTVGACLCGASDRPFEFRCGPALRARFPVRNTRRCERRLTDRMRRFRGCARQAVSASFQASRAVQDIEALTQQELALMCTSLAHCCDCISMWTLTWAAGQLER